MFWRRPLRREIRWSRRVVLAVSYDESVIMKFEERLYSRAATIVFVYSMLGLYPVHEPRSGVIDRRGAS